MANYSLLRYPGGKTRAINFLKEFIPNDTKEIYSPFFGGGSFEIFNALNGIQIHGYDNFKPLICFWKSLLNQPNSLKSEVEKYFPLEKEEFYSFQKKIHEEKDVLRIGAIYYVLNRSSFSGTGLSGGMSPNHPRFTKKQIDSIVNFKAKFNINKASFEESIKKHNCLIYADPPYLINKYLYGTNGDMHMGFNHHLLSQILNKRENFILSYNNCEIIRDLYSEHDFFYPKWKYGMNNNKESNEIIIVSKDLRNGE